MRHNEDHTADKENVFHHHKFPLDINKFQDLLKEF